MKKNVGKRGLIISLAMMIYLFSSVTYGQYTVGQTISQATRDKIVSLCANSSGNVSLGSLLEPEQGMSNRVLWLNFFESW